MENIEKNIEALKGHIETQLKAQEKALEEKNEAKVKEITEHLKGLESKVAEYNEKAGVTDKEVKDIHAEVAKMIDFKNQSEPMSVKGMIEKRVKEHAEKGMTKGQWYDILDTKAAADMTIGNFSGDPSVTYHGDGIKVNPRLVHIRQLLSMGAMSSEIYQYEQETARDGTAASAGEGVTVPRLDNDFTSKTAQAKKIGGFYRTSEESLKDVVWLASFLQSAGIDRVLNAEDSELLTSSSGFDGFDQAALSDAAGGLTAYQKTASDVTKFDCLQFALTKLLVNETQANGIVMNPIDYAAIYTATATDGQPLSPLYWVGGQPTVAGVPIYLSTAVTADTFFAGDWGNMTAQLLQRDGLSVKFFDQDGDNAVEGKVTIRIQERVALAIYKPTNILLGDFSDIIASLSA